MIIKMVYVLQITQQFPHQRVESVSLQVLVLLFPTVPAINYLDVNQQPFYQSANSTIISTKVNKLVNTDEYHAKNTQNNKPLTNLF